LRYPVLGQTGVERGMRNAGGDGAEPHRNRGLAGLFDLFRAGGPDIDVERSQQLLVIGRGDFVFLAALFGVIVIVDVRPVPSVMEPPRATVGRSVGESLGRPRARLRAQTGDLVLSTIIWRTARAALLKLPDNWRTCSAARAPSLSVSPACSIAWAPLRCSHAANPSAIACNASSFAISAARIAAVSSAAASWWLAGRSALMEHNMNIMRREFKGGLGENRWREAESAMTNLNR
jgi:hypothetical protein